MEPYKALQYLTDLQPYSRVTEVIKIIIINNTLYTECFQDVNKELCSLPYLLCEVVERYTLSICVCFLFVCGFIYPTHTIIIILPMMY